MSSCADVYLHFVWTTWRRVPMLVERRAPGVYESICRLSVELGCEPLAVGGMPDHVHLLVRSRAALAPATIAQKVKGASCYFANPMHGEAASLRWQQGYGVFSLSRRGVRFVRDYVNNQEAHHAAGTLIDVLERVPDPKR
jgi:putative transposase